MSCDGTGKSKVVFSTGEEEERCHTCDGKGTVTCAECAGKGILPNVHRKKILWVMGIGAACWLIVFWQLWGRDLLPEQTASVRSAIGAKGGGRSVKATDAHGARGDQRVQPNNNPAINVPNGQAPDVAQTRIR